MSSLQIRTMVALVAAAVSQAAFTAAAHAQDVHAHASAEQHAAPATHAAPMAEKPSHAAAAAATSSGAETGLAAVYSDRLNGHRTASGQRYHRNALTTAHKSLPFGTRIKVTNTKNRRSVELVVNDRGPTQAGRILDISAAAAKRLGISRHGMAEVSIEVVGEAPQHRR